MEGEQVGIRYCFWKPGHPERQCPGCSPSTRHHTTGSGFCLRTGNDYFAPRDYTVAPHEVQVTTLERASFRWAEPSIERENKKGIKRGRRALSNCIDKLGFIAALLLFEAPACIKWLMTNNFSPRALTKFGSRGEKLLWGGRRWEVRESADAKPRRLCGGSPELLSLVDDARRGELSTMRVDRVAR